MIKINDLSLEIKGKRLLSNINMEINDGEIVGFVGPNGSGKTLIMKCICGFINDYQGIITMDGIDVKNIQVKNMGIIIETPGFIPYYSGYNNLKILAQINNDCTNEEIITSMEDLGLSPYNKNPVKKYSLGMRQRLGVAQALMENKGTLILDEPFNGLDDEISQKLRQRLEAERKKQKTIIISSHNRFDIDYLCDRKYQIQKGRIVGTDDSLDYNLDKGSRGGSLSGDGVRPSFLTGVVD
ncbi:ABC-2 type transport system ATP-binding protein [Pseudobutyrivibrio sp. UC1225]|uniref:ATP-binding cassette domain-containing protein n=1 Tax=Pseudobutyrivibrio sp. UC1225 TaxID=1798185 RepID=UPI0008EFCFA6|nr:ATP-binding cassette domain-containing protein [Pseudobutyrivibrio sp. UC1225]SFO30244.1 ABC-2 type transport system ATP-binding protein [Pseudobutyrivibrio sp. UC1225]